MAHLGYFVLEKNRIVLQNELVQIDKKFQGYIANSILQTFILYQASTRWLYIRVM